MEAEMTYLLEEQTRKLENAEMLIERLKREVMALSFSVELHDRAAEKARALWAEAHPDEAEEWLRREDLMVWLMDRVEKAEAVKDSLTTALRDIKKNVDDWDLKDYVTIRRLVNPALRTTEDSSAVGLIDSTPAKQPEGTTKLEWALAHGCKRPCEYVKQMMVAHFCPIHYGMPNTVGCSTTSCTECWNQEVTE